MQLPRRAVERGDLLRFEPAVFDEPPSNTKFRRVTAAFSGHRTRRAPTYAGGIAKFIEFQPHSSVQLPGRAVERAALLRFEPAVFDELPSNPKFRRVAAAFSRHRTRRAQTYAGGIAKFIELQPHSSVQLPGRAMQRSPCFMFTSFIGASSSSTTSWRVIATSTGRRTPTRVLRVRRNGIGHLIPSAQPQPVTRARAAAQSLHSIKGHQRPWIAECARILRSWRTCLTASV